jgi:hypothetical protein
MAQPMLRAIVTMLYLIFAHTAQEPPLRLGPLPSFKLRGAELIDPAGATIARHDGHRWAVDGRQFYRVDIAGPVVVKPEVGGTHGPFEHFSLVNRSAYASRELFAHYSEKDGTWNVHYSDAQAQVFLVMPG